MCGTQQIAIVLESMHIGPMVDGFYESRVYMPSVRCRLTAGSGYYYGANGALEEGTVLTVFPNSPNSTPSTNKS